jgi:hypothetical protein
MTWLRADQQHRVGGHGALVPQTPLLLIHGPGGASINCAPTGLLFFSFRQITIMF